jgi:hypothetical protein
MLSLLSVSCPVQSSTAAQPSTAPRHLHSLGAWSLAPWATTESATKRQRETKIRAPAQRTAAAIPLHSPSPRLYWDHGVDLHDSSVFVSGTNGAQHQCKALTQRLRQFEFRSASVPSQAHQPANASPMHGPAPANPSAARCQPQSGRATAR